MSDVGWPTWTPKQQEFILSRAKYPFMWGGWGAAKSWALCMRVIMMCVKTDVFGDMRGNRGILGRWERKSLTDTTVKDFFELLPEEWLEGYNKQEGTIRIIGGSEIVLTSFKEFKVGGNYSFVAIDQAEEVPEELIRKVQGRTRMSKTTRGITIPEHCRSVFGVGNPNGHSWHWRTWEWNRILGNRGDASYDPRYHCIPCTTYDNAANLPNDYIENLEQNLTPKQLRVYVGYSWEDFAGRVYDEWSEADCVNADNEIPGSSWRKYIGIDHGYPSAKVASFLAIDPYWNGLLYDEVYMEDCKTEEFIRAIRAKLVQHQREMSEAEGFELDTRDQWSELELRKSSIKRNARNLEKIWMWCCDPSMRRRVGEQEASKPTAGALTEMAMYTHEASRQGFAMPLHPAQNDVMAGNDRVNWLFWNARPERKSLDLPSVRVNPRCTRHIETFEAYKYDQRSGKPAEGQDDHCADAFRYACVTAFPGDHFKKPDTTREPSEVEEIIERLIAQHDEEQSTFSHASGWI